MRCNYWVVKCPVKDKFFYTVGIDRMYCYTLISSESFMSYTYNYCGAKRLTFCTMQKVE